MHPYKINYRLLNGRASISLFPRVSQYVVESKDQLLSLTRTENQVSWARPKRKKQSQGEISQCEVRRNLSKLTEITLSTQTEARPHCVAQRHLTRLCLK